MVQYLLTFWFSVTTLIGPGVCCCTLFAPDSSSPSNEVPSCCQAEKSPTNDKNEPIQPVRDRSECPCKHLKVATSDKGVLLESVALGRTFDPFATLALTFRISTADHEFRIDCPPTHSPPSGRALLAMYHILRC